MFRITLSHVFDAEVIDNQTKDKTAVFVEPQSRRVGKGFVSVWGKEFLESIICNVTSLREAIHAFAHLSVDGALVDQIIKLV